MEDQCSVIHVALALVLLDCVVMLLHHVHHHREQQHRASNEKKSYLQVLVQLITQLGQECLHAFSDTFPHGRRHGIDGVVINLCFG